MNDRPIHGDATGEIMRALGRLEGKVHEMASRQQADNEVATESRRTLHQKVEALTVRVGDVEASQGRTVQACDALGKRVSDMGEALAQQQTAIAPSIEDWKRIRLLGQTAGGLFLLGGVSVGATLVWAKEAAAAAMRSFLGING